VKKRENSIIQWALGLWKVRKLKEVLPDIEVLRRGKSALKQTEKRG